jgi:hypothetical protein
MRGHMNAKLPACAIDDVVRPTNRAPRTKCHLLPPHTTDAALNSLSLKIFFEKGLMPDF